MSNTMPRHTDETSALSELLFGDHEHVYVLEQVSLVIGEPRGWDCLAHIVTEFESERFVMYRRRDPLCDWMDGQQELRQFSLDLLNARRNIAAHYLDLAVDEDLELTVTRTLRWTSFKSGALGLGPLPRADATVVAADAAKRCRAFRREIAALA